jgi:hypothetical protein
MQACRQGHHTGSAVGIRTCRHKAHGFQTNASGGRGVCNIRDSNAANDKHQRHITVGHTLLQTNKVVVDDETTWRCHELGRRQCEPAKGTRARQRQSILEANAHTGTQLVEAKTKSAHS